MPLAIRSVNRRVGSTAGFDADAAAYIRAVQIADGAALEPAVARAINAFVLGCKADNIWAAIADCVILMGARTLTGALTALKGTAPTNVNFVTGDYNRKTGLLGNGSTKRLDTNRNDNNYSQNDRHAAVYRSASESRDATRACLASSSVGGSVGLLTTTNTRFFRLSYGAAPEPSIIDTTTKTGFFGASRTGATAMTSRYDGTTTSFTSGSTAPTANAIQIFARAGGNFADARIAFYSMGTSLTLATLDTRASDLYTAIGNAIP